MTDTELLDWLESVLLPNDPPTEIFLAGLRTIGPASAFQCEIAPAAKPWTSYQGESLREAIAAARAAVPAPGADQP